MKNALVFTLAAVLMIACGDSKKAEATATDEETGYQYFGEELSSDDGKSLGELMAALETQDSVYAQIKAEVEGVCQTKGCWMNLVDSESAPDASIFVKFKDYGFFVPKDIAGKTVIVRGYAFKEVTPVDELKHYAEDEGKSQAEIDQITEPVEELKFMADGVIVM